MLFRRRGCCDAGLNIPDMSGGAFVETCHHEPRCSGVPVVVMAVTPRAAVEQASGRSLRFGRPPIGNAPRLWSSALCPNWSFWTYCQAARSMLARAVAS